MPNISISYYIFSTSMYHAHKWCHSSFPLWLRRDHKLALPCPINIQILCFFVLIFRYIMSFSPFISRAAFQILRLHDLKSPRNPLLVQCLLWYIVGYVMLTQSMVFSPGYPIMQQSSWWNGKQDMMWTNQQSKTIQCILLHVLWSLVGLGLLENYTYM